MTNEVWLFGEMSVNMDMKPTAFIKKAQRIAELCGYSVQVTNRNEELDSCNIMIHGEDFHDSAELVNYVNVFDGKISSLQKVIFTSEWINKYEGQEDTTDPHMIRIEKMRKVYTYNKSSEKFVLSFDCDKFRKDHPEHAKSFLEVIQ